MDPLSHLRGMIASLDETLVDSLCARAHLHLNEQFYAMSGHSSSSLDVLAGQVAESNTIAGRVLVLRPAYLRTLLPALCKPGQDEERGACLAADAACLDALARRLALSVHVATRKREAIPDALQSAICAGNPVGVEETITNPAVEFEVLARVKSRARNRTPHVETPDRIAALYAGWIIPLSRKIQVHGLLATS